MIADWQLAAEERGNGQRLSELFAPIGLPRIGIVAAGAEAYAFQGTSYDLLGLNYVRMAHADSVKTGPKGHQAFNRRVFFETMPDILLPETSPTGEHPNLQAISHNFYTRGTFVNEMFKNLFNDHGFKENYAFAVVENTGYPYQCYGFFSKSYLERLRVGGRYNLTLLA